MPGSSLKALAKINLALHVGALQRDGYHPVDTLCVYAAAGDVLTLGEPAQMFSLTISGPEGQGLKADTDNLILRGAAALASETVLSPCRLHLEKHVPVASGIGGGTSNGAAALVLLNARANTPLSSEHLLRLSQCLGADGPACLMPYLLPVSSVRARGIGFEVTKGPSLPPLHVVLANPRKGVPTGQVFRAFDEGPVPQPFDLPEENCLQLLDVTDYLKQTRNDLAPAARRICAQILHLEDQLLGSPGSLGARMSGSGATVFGLFSSIEAADRAARVLRAQNNWAISATLHRGKTP